MKGELYGNKTNADPIGRAVCNIQYRKKKKKKQTNSTYVTNTVTPPPQPAPVVPSAPPVTNKTQTLPKQNTASQTKSNLLNAAAYNPLSLKQNNTTQQSAMDTIYNKTVTYDAVPVPQIQHGSYKSPAQKSYSYTETKPTANTVTSVKANITAGKTAYNPYVTKDRVGNEQNSYSARPKSKVKTEQHKQNSSDLWSVPKTIKDGAQPKAVQSEIFSNNVQNYGINRETAQYMPAKTDPEKELYVEYLKRLTENNKGINRETAQTNFLDHRGQNPVEKFVEQSSFKGLDDFPVVTKDNIYQQTP